MRCVCNFKLGWMNDTVTSHKCMVFILHGMPCCLNGCLSMWITTFYVNCMECMISPFCLIIKKNLSHICVDHGFKMWPICDETTPLERFLSWLNSIFAATWNAISTL